MGKVITGGTMSLDGYISGPEESGFDLLFQWYGNGDVEIPSASPDVPPPHVSAASAELIKPEWENTGALVVGRCSPSSASHRCSSRGPSRWSRAPASRTCATGSRNRPPTIGRRGRPVAPEISVSSRVVVADARTTPSAAVSTCWSWAPSASG
jgi:hypothetical protein